MPALDALPAPPTIGSIGMASRWAQLPASTGLQLELITRARQNLSSSAMPRNGHPLPRVLPRTEYASLGELLGQEQLAGSSQMICRFRNTSATSGAGEGPPIAVMCQLGCCPQLPGGCCTMDEANPSAAVASVTATYHWVLALLCAFILCVFVSTVAMLALYWANRKQDIRRRRFLLAEKYSLGIGSSQPSSSYGAPSLASSNGPIGVQAPFCVHPPSAHLRHFYAADSPAPSSCMDRRPPHHLLRPYGVHQQQRTLEGTPPPAPCSAYHAPDEVFFRSSF